MIFMCHARSFGDDLGWAIGELQGPYRTSGWGARAVRFPSGSRGVAGALAADEHTAARGGASMTVAGRR